MTQAASDSAKLANAFSDGDSLVTQWGADLSPCCICCGKPASGKPISRRFETEKIEDPLSASGSRNALIDMAFLIIYAIFASAAQRAKNKRLPPKVVIFGLCAEHRLRRRVVKWLMLAAFLGGIGLFVASFIFNTAEKRTTGESNAFWQSAMPAGLIFACLVPLIISTKLQRLQFIEERGGWVWLSGAGKAFLNALVPMAQKA